MPAIDHAVEHLYQSTNNNCSQTALSMLLSHYGRTVTPEHIMQAIPVGTNDQGEPWGTINQQLATWCLAQGFGVVLYTFDCQIIDLSWSNLDNTQLAKRLRAATSHRDVPALGQDWSQRYAQSYLDFIKAGGQLYIQPHVTTKLLYELLQSGPLLLCVCFNTLYGTGRSRDVGLRKSEPDDLKGKITNHSIVLYGVTEAGDFKIADPWQKPGRHVIEPERLLCAITAAQIECDNLLFQLAPARSAKN